MAFKCVRCETLVKLNVDGSKRKIRRDGSICVSCAHKEMIYLATPYTHKNDEIREIRFRQACMIGAKLIEEGHRLFSPIVAYHPMSWYGNFKTDYHTFGSFCKIHMSISTILYIAEFSGWEDSVGVASEMLLAEQQGLPIFHVKILNA